MNQPSKTVTQQGTDQIKGFQKLVHDQVFVLSSEQHRSFENNHQNLFFKYQPAYRLQNRMRHGMKSSSRWSIRE